MRFWATTEQYETAALRRETGDDRAKVWMILDEHRARHGTIKYLPGPHRFLVEARVVALPRDAQPLVGIIKATASPTNDLDAALEMFGGSCPATEPMTTTKA